MLLAISNKEIFFTLLPFLTIFVLFILFLFWDDIVDYFTSEQIKEQKKLQEKKKKERKKTRFESPLDGIIRMQEFHMKEHEKALKERKERPMSKEVQERVDRHYKGVLDCGLMVTNYASGYANAIDKAFKK